jgi:signal transduction histidine kinase
VISSRSEDAHSHSSDRRFPTDPQRDRARLAVLAEVSLLLASSGDHVRVLAKLTELAVPALADWCTVHVLGATDQLERVAIRHVDPARLDTAEQLARSSRPNGRLWALCAARVVATGASEWVAQVDDAALDEIGDASWQREALRVLGLRSYVAVPLIVRGRTIGALTLVRGEYGHEYDRDDLAFAEELARRVAMYVDNALLLREVQLREAALRDEASRLETLNRIGQELAEIHDLDEVVKKVCDAATALTGAELGMFFTYAEGACRYALCGATFEEARHIAEQHPPTGPAAPGAQLTLQRVLRLDDVHAGAAPAGLGAFAGITRIRSLLAVPVCGRRGDVIGGIALGHARRAAFDVRGEQLVLGLASLTATATDSARLFREARELIAELETSNRDLDQFAYVTSHDLRAPLRGIANLSVWVEEDLGDRLTERAREHLRLLRGRVHRLEGLIEGVLDYSRAGRIADEPSEIDIAGLVRETVELLAPPPDARIHVADRLPTLHTSRVPLQQVFMNLIANALKHNPTPAPLVEIGAEPTGEGWEFYVRDNGPGISPQHHDRIWGLFQTLQSRDRIVEQSEGGRAPRGIVERSEAGSAPRGVDSSGLGLAIVRRIVEAHGGRTWLESDRGHGATFRFTWPRVLPRRGRWMATPVPR